MTHALPRRRAVPVALLGAGLAATAAGVWLLRRFDPNAAGHPFPPCVFHAATGLYCPGCGITRGLHALVHGDVPGALAMNPLLITLLLCTPLFVAWHAGWTPRALRPLAGWMSTATFWLTLLAVYGIARNLPWAPFVWMAPA